MIYITQLIFLKKGKESNFHEFENFAIPLMKKYGGKILYRIRPDDNAYIASLEKKPYEIHFISFECEEDLERFIKDEDRQKLIHLKNESIQSTLLIKGNKM